MRKIALALLHHPVLDRSGAVITTAITNLDLHDMARSSRSYGLSSMFVVHPIASQRELAERVRDHWLVGSGSKRIPDRVEAMKLIRVVACFDDVRRAFSNEQGEVETWTTSAQASGTTTSYEEARSNLQLSGPPVVLMFGTGWGLAPHLVEQASLRLEPIVAGTDTGFNHLSVRAACAISLDRLLR